MSDKTARPIIVIKKKGGHGGHHGGAWKVAYADFVTAMMSLFIVLWLLNSTPQVKKAIAGYFNDPRGTSKKMGTEMLGSGPQRHHRSDERGETRRVDQEGNRQAEGTGETGRPGGADIDR